VEVALVTGRPLLLRGAPGSGKSSLAAYVARNLGWRYYEHTVTASTQAESLLWHFDVVRRLADAQVHGGHPGFVLNDLDYVEPGPLWWVFNPDSARQRGFSEKSLRSLGVRPPATYGRDPNTELNAARHPDRAVLLIDELDKADPEVPNALLVPLGSRRFRVTDIDVEIAWKAVPAEDDGTPGAFGAAGRLLVVVTTNEERQLPPAFLRRCVVHRLDHPDADRLVEIAKLHFGETLLGEEGVAVCKELALRVEIMRTEAIESARRPPSTAEYLDAARACLTLSADVNDKRTWNVVRQAALMKDEREEPP
jgi:MoxR-like ATPase